MDFEIELLTVNLWGLPWPFARERRARQRRFAEHLARRPYHVVGIQELWWPWHRALRTPGLVRPRSSRDSGLALAGELPVREARVEHFRDHGGPDRLKRKGVLQACVEAPAGAELCVMVVHLQAGRDNARIRERQLDQILEGVAAESRPTVLMGDFNFYRGAEADAASALRLHDSGFVDAALDLRRGHDTYTASNPYVRRRDASDRFDRVYLRDAAQLQLKATEAEVLQLGPRPVSDHHPLRVRVRVRGERSARERRGPLPSRP